MPTAHRYPAVPGIPGNCPTGGFAAPILAASRPHKRECMEAVRNRNKTRKIADFLGFSAIDLILKLFRKEIATCVNYLLTIEARTWPRRKLTGPAIFGG